MKLTRIVISALIVAFVSVTLLAQATTAPAVTAASKPTTTSAPAIVATVGNTEIKATQLNKIFDMVSSRAEAAGQPIPAEQVEAVRFKILNQLVENELWHVYLDAKKVTLTEAELKEQKDQLAKAAAGMGKTAEELMSEFGLTEADLVDGGRKQKAAKEATEDAKAEAYVKAHPEYFRGTKLKVTHILLECPSGASTAKQKEVKARLEGIVADIKAGTISFEDAVKKYGDDPGIKKEGMYDMVFGMMVPEFSAAAFATKKGEVSPIIRSQFGFHVIKVLDRTDGKDEPDAKANIVAKNTLFGNLNADVLAQSAEALPVVVNVKSPAPSTQPATAPATEK